MLDAHTRERITVITKKYLGVLRFCRWFQPGHYQKLAQLISEIRVERSHSRCSVQIVKKSIYNLSTGACHYLTNRFQMEAPVAPSRNLREAFKRAPRNLRGACLREGFAEPPRRLHEPFAEVYEPFAEVAHTEGSTKTPWRVHEASSKGPWMNCMFLLDHDCNHVWSILYCV